MTKKDKLSVRTKLVDLAETLGFTVELDSKMSDYIDEAIYEEEMADHFDEDGNIVEEFRPAGDCHYLKRHIRVREGKSVTGQVCTLIHELCHALGLGGASWYSSLGEGYTELASESITQFVAQAVGIDRTHKTAPRVLSYGFKGYLVTSVTQAYTNLFCDALDVDRIVIEPTFFSLTKVN